MEEFSDIFKGSLKDSCMNMKPAEIVIDESVKSTHKPASTARDVLVFYKGAAKQHLKAMVEDDVIEEVHEPTAYCSRSIFLPKSKGKSLRLVIDFRTINKMILRPSWPFQAASSILSQIDPNKSFIATVDLLSGYHQVPLSYKSR